MASSTSPLAASEAQRAGDYLLVRRIGSGGMGEVWLGRHVVSGGLGAVKRLNPEAARRAHVRAFFAREGRAVARLAHPHIVPVFEIGEHHLVTAFVDGSNLARRMQTPITPGAAVRIVRQIAAALAHAHERGVIHRDVKPSNILLDHQDNAYLADFGVAAIAGEAESIDMPGRIAGTPQFMAPEQRRGEPVGPAADQYALGRTLLELLAGGRTSTDPQAALAELPAGLPTALHDSIARATAAGPGDRFPSLAAFADTLALIDLSAHGAPVRIATSIRDDAAYRWCVGAHRVEELGADLMRADYRVGELAASGFLSASRVRGFFAERGLAELGFSVYGSSARLGALSDPWAYARCAEIVVLMHGWATTRDAFSLVAQAVCRDNAQALVLVPDLHGFGETQFARVPRPHQAAIAAIAQTTNALRTLLAVDVIPTVLVGHSMSGISLLALDEADLLGHVSRIAINPVLTNRDNKLRHEFRAGAWMTATVGRVTMVRRFLTRAMITRSPVTKELTRAVIDASVEQMMQMPAPVMARILHAFSTTPRQLPRQRRVIALVCVDDPLIDRAAFEEVAVTLGLGPESICYLASGGHAPHLARADHPEWTARNVAEIVHQIDSMMLTAREATQISSTVSGGPTLASAPTRTI